MLALLGRAATVRFDIKQLTGAAESRDIYITPTNVPGWTIPNENAIYTARPLVLRPVGGVAQTNIVSGVYRVTFAGLPGAFLLAVPDDSATYNAAELILNMPVFTYTNAFAGGGGGSSEFIANDDDNITVSTNNTLNGTLYRIGLADTIHGSGAGLTNLPAIAEVINVRNYGVKGDGVTDDWPALQNLLSQTNFSYPPIGGYRVVYFPSGVYLISSNIIWPVGCRLIGEGPAVNNQVSPIRGTLIRPHPSWNGGEALIDSLTWYKGEWQHFSSIENIALDGRKPGENIPVVNYGVRVNHPGELCRIYNVKMISFGRAGIWAAGNLATLMVEDVSISRCGWFAIMLTASTPYTTPFGAPGQPWTAAGNAIIRNLSSDLCGLAIIGMNANHFVTVDGAKIEQISQDPNIPSLWPNRAGTNIFYLTDQQLDQAPGHGARCTIYWNGGTINHLPNNNQPDTRTGNFFFSDASTITPRLALSGARVYGGTVPYYWYKTPTKELARSGQAGIDDFPKVTLNTQTAEELFNVANDRLMVINRSDWPVLTNAADEDVLTFPSVVWDPVNGKWHLYVSRSTTTDQNQHIALFVSSNAKTWDRHGNVVLPGGSGGFANEIFCGVPVVWLESNGTWWMAYLSQLSPGTPSWAIAFASSTDGTNWTKQQRLNLPGHWSYGNTEPVNVLRVGGTNFLYHTTVWSDPNGRRIGVLWSADNVTWYAHPEPVITTPTRHGHGVANGVVLPMRGSYWAILPFYSVGIAVAGFGLWNADNPWLTNAVFHGTVMGTRANTWDNRAVDVVGVFTDDHTRTTWNAIGGRMLFYYGALGWGWTWNGVYEPWVMGSAEFAWGTGDPGVVEDSGFLWADFLNVNNTNVNFAFRLDVAGQAQVRSNLVVGENLIVGLRSNVFKKTYTAPAYSTNWVRIAETVDSVARWYDGEFRLWWGTSGRHGLYRVVVNGMWHNLSRSPVVQVFGSAYNSPQIVSAVRLVYPPDATSGKAYIDVLVENETSASHAIRIAFIETSAYGLLLLDPVVVTDPIAPYTGAKVVVSSLDKTSWRVSNAYGGVSIDSTDGYVNTAALRVTNRLVVGAAADSSAVIIGNGSGITNIQPSGIAQSGATAGQVLKWSGTQWAPGADESGGGLNTTNAMPDYPFSLPITVDPAAGNARAGWMPAPAAMLDYWAPSMWFHVPNSGTTPAASPGGTFAIDGIAAAVRTNTIGDISAYSINIRTNGSDASARLRYGGNLAPRAGAWGGFRAIIGINHTNNCRIYIGPGTATLNVPDDGGSTPVKLIGLAVIGGEWKYVFYPGSGAVSYQSFSPRIFASTNNGGNYAIAGLVLPDGRMQFVINGHVFIPPNTVSSLLSDSDGVSTHVFYTATAPDVTAGMRVYRFEIIERERRWEPLW